MAKSGDSFGKGSNKPYSGGNLLTPNEETFSSRVLYALNSMLGIDVPEFNRLSVFIQSYALGKPGDPAIDLNAPNLNWSLIGFLKAFAPVALDYRTELQAVNAELNTVTARLDAVLLEVQAINVGVTAAISELQDIDTGVTTLNGTAVDILNRLDSPIQTYL